MCGDGSLARARSIAPPGEGQTGARITNQSALRALFLSTFARRPGVSVTPQAWTSLGAAQRASAAMRPHLQGVLPEGNQYLLSPEDAAAAARSRAEGLGALARLPDDLILRVLSGGDDDDGAGPSALAALARCSRICRAFALPRGPVESRRAHPLGRRLRLRRRELARHPRRGDRPRARRRRRPRRRHRRRDDSHRGRVPRARIRPRPRPRPSSPTRCTCATSPRTSPSIPIGSRATTSPARTPRDSPSRISSVDSNPRTSPSS